MCDEGRLTYKPFNDGRVLEARVGKAPGRPRGAAVAEAAAGAAPARRAGGAGAAALARGLARGPAGRLRGGQGGAGRHRGLRRRPAATAGTTSSSSRPTRTPTARRLELAAQAFGLAVKPVAELAAAVAGARSRPSGRSGPRSPRRGPRRWPGPRRWWSRPCNDGDAGRRRHRAAAGLARAEADGTFVNFEGRGRSASRRPGYPRGEAPPARGLCAEAGARARAGLAVAHRPRGLAGALAEAGRALGPGLQVGLAAVGRPPPGLVPLAAGTVDGRLAGQKERMAPEGAEPSSAASRRAAGEEERVKRFFGMSLVTLAVLVGPRRALRRLLLGGRRAGLGLQRGSPWPAGTRPAPSAAAIVQRADAHDGGPHDLRRRCSRWPSASGRRSCRTASAPTASRWAATRWAASPTCWPTRSRCSPRSAIDPAARTKLLFELAPVLSFAPGLLPLRHRPGRPGGRPGRLLRRRPAPAVRWRCRSPIDAGLLYLFAIASLSVYGTSLAGWASNNKLALLGGVRASSQMISYEVSLGLSLVGTMMAYKTLQLEEMVVAQGADGARRRAGARACCSSRSASSSSSPPASPRPSAPPSTCPRARARSSATSSSTRA